ARVDLLAAGREIGIDGDDLAVTDPDVGATPGGAGSVDHRAAANHDIEARAVHRRHANTGFAGASGGYTAREVSEHESVAGALLAELEAGGELVDAAGFSTDAAQARAKLREFQLADPYEYVLLLIEAAVLAGAEPVRIRTGGGELTVSLGPLRVHREELEQLFAAAFVDLSGADPAERNR